MKTKTTLRFADLPKDYAALCGVLMPRPVHDAAGYANVAEITDALALWQDGFPPTSATISTSSPRCWRSTTANTSVGRRSASVPGCDTCWTKPA